jgi:crotonobetainyl-CoA:carnitine CoA-transferase CaiB-like acyl-CoA transferase
MLELQAAGIPAGVAQTLEDIVQHDAYLANEYYQRNEKDGIEYRIFGPAFRFTGLRSPVGLLSDIGADTERVLVADMKLDAAYVTKLRDDGVLT